MIYFDNPATSWPKPESVVQAMVSFMIEVGGNPGRSGHRQSVQAARIVYDTREALAELFGVGDPLRIIFTSDATQAINLVVNGYLRPGDHVVTTSIEHNALMRPLRALERQGVALTVVPCSPEGILDPADVEESIRPNTALIAVNHASNVVGTILPVAQVGEIARRHGIPLLVDAAQTAGAIPLHVEEMGIDLLAFTGHKALLGPMGTGGLCIGPRVDLERLRPLVRGGTGSRSESEEQPDFLPDKYESGTLNAVGIAGLGAGVRYILDRGLREIQEHETALTARLLAGLATIPGVTVYGPRDPEQQVPTISFNVVGMEPSEVGQRLDEEYEVLCRVGLHCAPAAHRTIGTFPHGTVRWGLSVFNTESEVDAALDALRHIAKG